MATYVSHRRVSPFALKQASHQQRPQSSCAEKLLSVLLVVAFVALGFAVVIAVIGPKLSSSPIRLEPAKENRSSGVQTATREKDSAPAKPQFVEPGPQEIVRLRTAAKVLDPEVMQEMPDTFRSDVKNPCWTRSDGVFRCLPYFYVTGMFHAGGQSLAEKLRAHPDVLTDACSGCQFWGEEGKAMAFYLEHMREAARAINDAPAIKVLMDSSLSTYAFYWAGGGKAHRAYADAMKPCYKECVDKFHTEKIPVDVCMDKNCHNASLAADEKRAANAGIDYNLEAHNPLLVRAVYGNRPPKMILVARDPIARLYSAFHGYHHYHSKYGKTSAGFTAYVKEQVGAFRACAADYGEQRCALLFEALGAREEKVYFHCDQLMRGMYGLFLEIWYRFVPPSNWMVVHSDDFFHQPKEVLQRAIDFLGLTQVNDTVMEAMANAGRVNSYTTGQQPIEPEARHLLAELYAPYNKQLAQLTGDARFENWNQQA